MKILDNNDGLTLIETVIALTLVVLLTAAFAGAMVVGLQSETTSDNLDYSSNLSASIFGFLLTENNYYDIIKASIDNNLIDPDDKDSFYEKNLSVNQESFYNDLINLKIDEGKDEDEKIEEKFKDIITSFDEISGYNVLAEESKIKIDKKITTSTEDSEDKLVLYRVELTIVSVGAKSKENYTISTILGDLNE